ncbi:MAG: HEPN domain-containing protein [Ignavibacteriae bacterium]|nr:HEPN domain-containing protein [Ignavibacteriota bacterium]
MDDKIKYWFDTADDDLLTAKAMLSTKRFLYVGFMCFQATEKVLKGFYHNQAKATPPYTHNLLKLARESGLFESLDDDQRDFLDWVQPLNIEARYPAYKAKLYLTLDERQWEVVLKKTEEFVIWIKKKLSESSGDTLTS